MRWSGWNSTLVDVSSRLLDTAVARLRGSRLDDRIAGARLASASDLSFVPDGSEELLLAGTEFFASLNQESFLAATPENQERWLEIVEQTASSPEGLGIADGPLFVGRKRA